MDEQNIIIYNTADGKVKVALMAKDGQVWMNQNQLAELFATSVPNISMHIANILNDNELVRDSVIKDYLITAADGKEYNVKFYSLDMILAIGFRVRSKRGVQFRIWANQHLKEYMIKGFTMDDERLKNPDGRPDYFDELLERIREIRASEKRFYQKVRDLLKLSSDYDATDKATQMFFAETQNKLLFAVTHQTAAEIIVSRADPAAPNMALTAWEGAVVRKGDALIAKNYLKQDEIDMLGVKDIIAVDENGILYAERGAGIRDHKKELCQVTNLTGMRGTLADALRGADVFVGVSVPGVLTAEMIRTMAKDPIVFAMANPTPEIAYDEAKAAGVRVMGTGRSDFPNQINNLLAFPGVFKGALSVRARDINYEMKVAAAEAIAAVIPADELCEENIIPSVFDPRVTERVAAAVAKAWQAGCGEKRR